MQIHTLFICKLPFGTRSHELRRILENYGVICVRIRTNRTYGYVDFYTEADMKYMLRCKLFYKGRKVLFKPLTPKKQYITENELKSQITSSTIQECIIKKEDEIISTKKNIGLF